MPTQIMDAVNIAAICFLVFGIIALLVALLFFYWRYKYIKDHKNKLYDNDYNDEEQLLKLFACAGLIVAIIFLAISGAIKYKFVQEIAIEYYKMYF